jgi:hypothetical protein
MPGIVGEITRRAPTRFVGILKGILYMKQQDDGFIPIISSTDDSDEKSDLRRAFRNTAKLALSNKACALAILPYKTNGSQHGHKVLDNAAAVNALIEAAPPELRTVLQMTGLKMFEKTQALDQVLRANYEMDKRGKLTGQFSQKYLARRPSAVEAEHEGAQA